MDTSKTRESIDERRRSFMSGAAIIAAATTFGTLSSSRSSRAEAPPPSRTNASLGPVKHINPGLLDLAYAEAGPTDGANVILLHGWPYDIHSFVEVTPMLAAAGYRVPVPYLRGYGPTRFLSNETFRNGQPAREADMPEGHFAP
ncbi:alpha/beta fold hydrolase [Bradyrhizobium nanningense]|uniref:alpha/beta fold hydrolase n=1 Tax=Bradyrhizobium nanningense TaxID=1325118 RepID=UPI001008F851|nr:hypothetical protein [Bradyrhizobium nanningense]